MENVMNSKRSRFLRCLLLVAPGFSLVPAVSAQSPAAVKERVAAVKQSLQTSVQALHQLEWIETTTVTIKGEQKAQLLKKCYYGMDGKVQKVPVLPPGQGAKRNEKLADFVESAMALLDKYVPPDPTLIQRSVDHGKTSIQVLDPGRAAALLFSDYILPGDKLSLTLDLTKNTLTSCSVVTYLEEPKDSVTLNFGFASLVDGPTYPASITLAAPSKDLQIAVENSGYRKPAQ
jgi:hypothetical protein